MAPLTCWICGFYGAVRGLIRHEVDRDASWRACWRYRRSDGAVPVRNAFGACGFAAADRRQVAAQAGLAGATAADRAARGVRGGGRGLGRRAADQLARSRPAAVWQLTRGAGQRVAVIDTGVSRHRRLPDVVPGGDYVSTGDGTQDCDAHGTLVAGIIAATADSDGFSGVAPDVTLISIRQSSAKFAPASDRVRRRGR